MNLSEQRNRVCGVSWHGQYHKAQIEIGKDVSWFFSKEHKEIIIFIGNMKYYTRLPNSFFTNCKHLRTAYDTTSYKGINRLHKWIKENNVKKVKLVPLRKFKEFRLTKYE